MVPIIKDDKLTRVADSVKLDAKGRVHLPKVITGEGFTYHIYTNSAGQIILDPQVTIPASEAWLFKDKTNLASVDKGMAEAARGQVKNRGSFAKHIK